MGRVAGGYSAYAKKMLSLGLYPESFREVLSEMQLQYFTVGDIDLTLNGEVRSLVPAESLVESVQSSLVLASEAKQGVEPFVITQGNVLGTIQSTNFSYTEGWLQLKVVARVLGPTDINTVTLTNLSSGQEEVLTIRPDFLPTIVDISTLPKEIQQYLRIDEICIEIPEISIREGAASLARIVKAVYEEHKESGNPACSVLLGKSIILSSASKVIVENDTLTNTALLNELRDSMQTLSGLAQEFLVATYEKSID